MAKRPNYLLGYGERLTEPVEVKGGPVEKHPPYSFEEAKARPGPMLAATVSDLRQLPESACPDGQVVASFTLHPEYLAKSYFPGGLLQEAGLRAVGSKARTITPEKRSRDRKPEEAVTTELFVAGARSSFENLARTLPARRETPALAQQLASIERIESLPSARRVKALPQKKGPIAMEIALHAGEGTRDQFIIRGFQKYLAEQGLEPDLERVFFAGRLCFLRMRARPDQADDIAKFSFLRVLREMPRLRTT